jgi:3-oxoacyl-[acyl-carrier protein] reductase
MECYSPVKETMKMRLAGKVAIVTGAGSGIGRGIALLFAKEGASIVVADINDVNGQDTVSIIKSESGNASFMHADVSIASDVSSLVRRTVEGFGKIDIIVNNAGMLFGGGEIQDVDEASWDRCFAVNPKSVFLTAKYAVPEMKKAGGGVIVNIASLAGIRPMPCTAVYSASKGAIISLTKALAIELAKSRIRVNSISPDATDTPGILTAGIGPKDLSPEDFLKERAQHVPLGRINTTQDIAYAALYLASSESSTVTGVNLIVDGGHGI